MQTVQVGERTLELPDIGESIELKVTETHFQRGIRSKCYRCPFAVAANELFGEGLASGVTRTLLSLAIVRGPNCGTIAIFRISNDGVEAIRQFDQINKASPGVYQLTRLQ